MCLLCVYMCLSQYKTTFFPLSMCSTLKNLWFFHGRSGRSRRGVESLNFVPGLLSSIALHSVGEPRAFWIGLSQQKQLLGIWTANFINITGDMWWLEHWWNVWGNDGEWWLIMVNNHWLRWWLEPWNFYDFPFSWECHHPNWRSHIFQDG